MDTPVLTTKLYIPPPRPGLVARPRLIEQLNQGSRRKLTVISAPAGFGKTTLLSTWIGQAKSIPNSNPQIQNPKSKIQNRVSWLSLDSADNDPARFLTYFIAALQQIDPDIGHTARGMLRTPQRPRLETLLTHLLNDVAAFPAEFSLVLDDYHAIDNPEIHAALDFLVAHLPAHAHLIIASRSQPPLSLSRLRGQAQLLELDSADLRFTAVEVEKFLKEAMQLDLSPADRIALEMRTEGWIAGLQLAGLSLQGQEDKAAFISSFSGTDRLIGDYLFEEVLQRQPAEIRRFLLFTSVPDSLCGGLCDALLAESGGQAMLEKLESLQLFIMPLDNQRRWYRYHHLFVESLRHHLRRTHPDQIPALHRRASAWFEQHDRLEEAIRHGLEARDFERAAGLIETAFGRSWVQRDMRRLLAWFEALPETVTHARPRLALSYAWLLLEIFSDQWERIEAQLRRVEDLLAAPGPTPALPEREASHILAEVDLLRANHARHAGQPARVIALCQQALDRLAEDETYLRSAIIGHLASAYESLGSLPEAGRLYTESIRLCRVAGNVDGLLFAAARLLEVLSLSGQLRRAETVFEQVLEYAGERTGPDMGLVYIGIGEVYRELNRLERARSYLEQGLEMCRPFEAWRAGVTAGVISLARVLAAAGQPGAALQALQELEDQPSPAAAREHARLRLAGGDLEAAGRWARRSGLSATGEADYAREADHLTLARVLIARGDLDGATALLARLSQAAEAGGRMGRVIEIQLLLALAGQAGGDAARALAALEQALSLAEPEGYVRIFVDAGEPLAQLLRQAAARGIAPAYAGRLLAAFQAEEKRSAAPPAPSPAPPPLLDPLTERELETLKFLATDLSVPEIAAEMVVAVSTLRTHIKRIYSKLDVHSRIEAIHRAQELKLL